MSICRRIQEHNGGVGSISTEPLHLRPYALFAYICGFDGKTDLLFYIERIWKERRDRLIRQGVNDAKSWALCGEEINPGNKWRKLWCRTNRFDISLSFLNKCYKNYFHHFCMYPNDSKYICNDCII